MPGSPPQEPQASLETKALAGVQVGGTAAVTAVDTEGLPSTAGGGFPATAVKAEAVDSARAAPEAAPTGALVGPWTVAAAVTATATGDAAATAGGLMASLPPPCSPLVDSVLLAGASPLPPPGGEPPPAEVVNFSTSRFTRSRSLVRR